MKEQHNLGIQRYIQDTIYIRSSVLNIQVMTAREGNSAYL